MYRMNGGFESVVLQLYQPGRRYSQWFIAGFLLHNGSHASYRWRTADPATGQRRRRGESS